MRVSRTQHNDPSPQASGCFGECAKPVTCHRLRQNPDQLEPRTPRHQTGWPVLERTVQSGVWLTTTMASLEIVLSLNTYRRSSEQIQLNQKGNDLDKIGECLTSDLAKESCKLVFHALLVFIHTC